MTMVLLEKFVNEGDIAMREIGPKYPGVGNYVV